jgi:hypothetical protein
VSHYYLNGNFKFATSFKDQRIETCHMAMLNNLDKTSFVRPKHVLINHSDILRWFWSLQVANDHPMKITCGPSQQPNIRNKKHGRLMFV